MFAYSDLVRPICYNLSYLDLYRLSRVDHSTCSLVSPFLHLDKRTPDLVLKFNECKFTLISETRSDLPNVYVYTLILSNILPYTMKPLKFASEFYTGPIHLTSIEGIMRASMWARDGKAEYIVHAGRRVDDAKVDWWYVRKFRNPHPMRWCIAWFMNYVREGYIPLSNYIPLNDAVAELIDVHPEWTLDQLMESPELCTIMSA